MTRAAAALLFSAALLAAQHAPDDRHATPAGGHEAAGAAAEHGTAEHANPNEIWWKWANFAILAGVLGYMIGKNAGPFFRGRTADIRKGIDEASKARMAAEARMRDVDARLANLSSEIESLKKAAGAEQAAEAERLRRETVAEVAKVQTHAEQEIEAAGKAARSELTRYTAELALGLAEQKIRQRMTPQAQDALLREFAEQLPQRPS
jgi:F-type H+-transporting ATPase subunit b